jgi:5-methylcytosine-specific restriction endonuclease McrA
MLKRCSKCKAIKDTSEFHRDRTTKDGFQTFCKICIVLYHKEHKDKIKKQKKEYYEEHKDEIKKASRGYSKTEKGKMLKRQRSNKRRAQKKNLEATLTTKQWAYILKKQNNRCNICGKKFTAKRQPAQDHIIPIKHNGCYTSDNIQALCKSCNSSKKAKLDLHYIQVWNYSEANTNI